MKTDEIKTILTRYNKGKDKQPNALFKIIQEDKSITADALDALTTDSIKKLCVNDQHAKDALTGLSGIDPDTIDSVKGLMYKAESNAGSCLERMIADYDKGIFEKYHEIGGRFPGLDKVFNGGLYSGLYTIGAITSLGKTTFIINLADALAQGGNDVIIFALEMNQDEYIKRSLSRISYELALKRYADKKQTTATTNAYSEARMLSEFSNKDIIKQCAAEYKKYSDHIFIKSYIGDCTVERIANTVKTHKDTTGNTPIVIVDFFQLLTAPEGYRYTDKQIADKNILDLKKLANKYKMPILNISSFNRGSYNDFVSLESFKESGNIEYISENVIGLYYSELPPPKYSGGKMTNKADIENTKNQIWENVKTKQISIGITLDILKQRKGGKGKIDLWYNPTFGYFSESLPEWEKDLHNYTKEETQPNDTQKEPTEQKGKGKSRTHKSVLEVL